MRLRFFFSCCALVFYSIFVLRAQDLRWEPTNGPYSSTVFCFTSNDSIIFAGTNDNLFRSRDSGKTWVKTLDAYSSAFPVYALALFGTKLYAGTPYGVICMGINGGSTICTTGITKTKVQAIAANKTGTFAGTNLAGVFYSNNGQTWSPYNVGLTPNITALAVAGNVLYAGSPLGMYRSTNNGLEWTSINTGLLNKNVQALAVTEALVFAATEGGVFRSQDSGNTWSPVNNGLADLNTKTLIISGSTVFAATSTGTVFRSTDYGSLWQIVQYDFQGAQVLSLGKLGKVIVAGTQGGGIFRSVDNGISWELSSYGLTQLNFSTIFSSDSRVFATSNTELYSTTNRGADWQTWSSMPINSAVFTVLGKIIFVSRPDGWETHRSIDEGKAWTKMKIESNDQVTSIVSIPPFLLLSLSNSSVFRSSDTGATWNYLATHKVRLARIYSIPNTSVLFALSNWDSTGQRSRDSGRTWIPFNSSQFFPTNIIRLHGNSFLAATLLGLLRSDDEGITWQLVRFRDSSVTTVISHGATIFASVRGGVFRSNDDGVHWAAVNSGLSELDVTSLNIHNGMLFASTRNGIFRAALPVAATSVSQSVYGDRKAPTLRYLSINPNPTTDKVTLQLDLAAATPVEIFLFNTLGQLVRQQSLGSLAAGAYDVEQEMNGIPTGSYTLVIQASSERTARRVQVIR